MADMFCYEAAGQNFVYVLLNFGEFCAFWLLI